MDENGDAEGNYTLVSRQRQSDASKGYGLFPAGRFAKPRNLTKNPVNVFIYFVTYVKTKKKTKRIIYTGVDVGGERRMDFWETSRGRTSLRVSRPEVHQ